MKLPATPWPRVGAVRGPHFSGSSGGGGGGGGMSVGGGLLCGAMDAQTHQKGPSSWATKARQWPGPDQSDTDLIHNSFENKYVVLDSVRVQYKTLKHFGKTTSSWHLRFQPQ